MADVYSVPTIGGKTISDIYAVGPDGQPHQITCAYKGSEHIYGWIRHLSKSTTIRAATDWGATLRPTTTEKGYANEPHSWIGSSYTTSWLAFSTTWGTGVYLYGIGAEAGWQTVPQTYIFTATKKASTTSTDGGNSTRTGLYGTSGCNLQTITSKKVNGEFPLITRMRLSPYAGMRKEYASYGYAVTRSNTAAKPDYLNFKNNSNWFCGYNGATGNHVLSTGWQFRAKLNIQNGSAGLVTAIVDFNENTLKYNLGWRAANPARVILDVDFRPALLNLKLQHGAYTKTIDLCTRVNVGSSTEYDSAGILLNGIQLYKDDQSIIEA